MNALLLHGGKITAKVTKDSNTCLCAKTARNLLAQFHHAKIGLGPIVIKRHVKIMHETQDQVLILMQADQEIEGIAFLWCASFADALLWGRIGSHSALDEFCVATFKVLLNGLRQARHPLLPCPLNARFDFQEQRFHLFGPQLFKAFENKGQFAQIMSITQRSEEHTSELQSRLHLVCRLLLEKKKNNTI